MTRAFRDNEGYDKSGPYAAAQSAVAAATAISHENERFARSTATSFSVVEVVFPVVLVKGRLFEFYVDDNGSDHLEEVTQVAASVPHPTRPGVIVYPLIATAATWPDKASDLAVGAQRLLEILVNRAPAIVKWYVDQADTTQRWRRNDAT